VEEKYLFQGKKGYGFLFLLTRKRDEIILALTFKTGGKDEAD
jgi:hypothetical protein